MLTGLRRHCRVDGDSMQPTLSPGDVVIYRPITPNNLYLEKGCLVVLKHPLEQETLIVKRVFQDQTWGIELRGDNERNSIDSRQFGLVDRNKLCGIVEQIIPKSKK